MSSGAAASSTSTRPAKPSSAPARRPTASPGAERLLLDGDRHALVGVAGVGRGDDDDPVGAGLPGRTRSPSRRPAGRAAGAGASAAAERMRVPSPPAMTTAARSGRELTGWRWLGRQDSNLGSRDQNPLPYHLATPHQFDCASALACGLRRLLAEQQDERDRREDADDDQRERRRSGSRPRRGSPRTPARRPRSRRADGRCRSPSVRPAKR